MWQRIGLFVTLQSKTVKNCTLTLGGLTLQASTDENKCLQFTLSHKNIVCVRIYLFVCTVQENVNSQYEV